MTGRVGHLPTLRKFVQKIHGVRQSLKNTFGRRLCTFFVCHEIARFLGMSRQLFTCFSSFWCQVLSPGSFWVFVPLLVWGGVTIIWADWWRPHRLIDLKFIHTQDIFHLVKISSTLETKAKEMLHLPQPKVARKKEKQQNPLNMARMQITIMMMI